MVRFFPTVNQVISLFCIFLCSCSNRPKEFAYWRELWHGLLRLPAGMEDLILSKAESVAGDGSALNPLWWHLVMAPAQGHASFPGQPVTNSSEE